MKVARSGKNCFSWFEPEAWSRTGNDYRKDGKKSLTHEWLPIYLIWSCQRNNNSNNKIGGFRNKSTHDTHDLRRLVWACTTLGATQRLVCPIWSRSNSQPLVNSIFETCSKPLRYCGDKSQWKSHLVYACDFEVATYSATKIASSCRDKYRLYKRAFK